MQTLEAEEGFSLLGNESVGGQTSEDHLQERRHKHVTRPLGVGKQPVELLLAFQLFSKGHLKASRRHLTMGGFGSGGGEKEQVMGEEAGEAG